MKKQKTKTENNILTPKERGLAEESMWNSGFRFSAFVTPILALIIIALSVGIGYFALQDQNSKQALIDFKQKLENSEKDLRSNKLNVDDLESEIAALEKQIEEKKKADEEEVAKKAKENEKGFIEGSLGYPSSYIPQNMQVCALNLETKKEYCTSEQLYDDKYTYRVGYKIEVQTGTYNVYASVPEWQDYKAYYSEFVTCGLGYNCPSHTPLEVKVTKDQTIEKIDPIDWYNK